MEVQATRDFSESRKLTLVTNDLVTVIDHGWVKGKGGRGKSMKKNFDQHNGLLLR